MGGQGFAELGALLGAEDEVMIEPGDQVAEGELLLGRGPDGELFPVQGDLLLAEVGLEDLDQSLLIIFRGSFAARWAAVIGRRMASTYFLVASQRACSAPCAIALRCSAVGRQATRMMWNSARRIGRTCIIICWT